MRLSTAFSFILAAIVGACSSPNPNHCANQQGHATCQKNGDDNIYCSKCVADNNGCVAEVNDSCDAGSTSEPATSSTSATTTTGDPLPTTSSSTSTSTSTTDPTTTSTTTSGDPTTTTGTDTTTTSTTADPSTGTTADTTTGTTADTTTDESTDTMGTTGTTGTTTDDTDDTDSTTGQVCGDNVQEPPETCDGTDLNGLDLCTQKNPVKYGGGALKCSGNCMNYVEDNCCVATGQACPPAPQKCCKNPNGLCVLTCG
jgi:hypothetical protein